MLLYNYISYVKNEGWNIAMKRLSIFLLLTTILSLLYGCSDSPDVQSSIPEKAPKDFAVHFETWIIEERKNVFDTFDGYIQKDLIQNGIEKKDYKISKADLDEIYKKVYAIKDIEKSMNSNNLSQESTYIYVSPLTYYVITLRADGVTYTIEGDYTSSYFKESSTEAAAFWEAVTFLRDFMHNTEEYQSMPEAVGGYD